VVEYWLPPENCKDMHIIYVPIKPTRLTKKNDRTFLLCTIRFRLSSFALC
jgi:hypothetical protein